MYTLIPKLPFRNASHIKTPDVICIDPLYSQCKITLLPADAQVCCEVLPYGQILEVLLVVDDQAFLVGEMQ